MVVNSDLMGSFKDKNTAHVDARACFKPESKWLWFRGVRSSKFRHVYGQPVRREKCYDNVNITKNAHDSQFCAVNPKFIAIVTEVAGGGAFIVLPLDSTGRIDVNTYKVAGHTGPVLDVKWNPFNDNVIASCSDDCTIKVWYIPEGGLKSNLTDWEADLHGHKRRVGYIEWHPTAENVIASVGFDYLIMLWDIGKGDVLHIIDCHNDVIQSLSFNYDGSRLATTCKDKKLRVINPRTGFVISEGLCHNGSSRSSKAVYLKNGLLATVGFSRLSDRQLAIWNEDDLSNPLTTEVIDSSSGVIFPYFDYDTNILFLAGKGDGNIRYYEVVDAAPWVHFLSQYISGTPQRSMCFMPKRGCDINKCEIFRFYKLHTSKPLCEPISMIVPRKSDQFQDDLYPDTAAPTASVSASDWYNGVNRPPTLMSMKAGGVKTHKPKVPSVTRNHMNPNMGADLKYNVKLAFLNTNDRPDYRPIDQRENSLVPDVVQNTIPTHIIKPAQELTVQAPPPTFEPSNSSLPVVDALENSSHVCDDVENEENEKSVKTSNNQSTKFQQIQRKFGKTIFSEEKSNKAMDMLDVEKLQRDYNRLVEENVLLRKQVVNRDKRIEDLESQVKKLKATIKGM
uniref:Coronin n=1 Tax=Lygus hesperus TaxID=30085 RepID=A0A0K8T8M4_LYGHE